MDAKQGQVETLSQVLSILCCCLIDFKLCLLGNTPQDQLCKIGRAVPNAALGLVNPSCAC